MRLWILSAAVLAVVFTVSPAWAKTNLEAGAAVETTPESLNELRQIPVQQGGRVKPFDSFARESVQRLTGVERVGNQPAVVTVLSIMAHPDSWQEKPVLSVPFVPLREILGMNPKETHVSYANLIETRKLMRQLPVIVQKQQQGEKLTMLENETMELYDRFVLFTALTQGKLSASDTDSWDKPSAKIQTAHWRIRWELLYNDCAPFKIARIFYLLTALTLLGVVLGARFKPGTLAKALLAGAVFFHAAGIVSRVVLGGRPPVSNFYETMLWLPFVAVFVALIFERIYRSGLFAFSSSILAAAFLVLADYMPLDSSISPVVAVLRSNLWLTIHVLTVVGSYAPIGLAAVMAHLYGILYLRYGPTHPRLAVLDRFIYRATQVGVVMLAAGIMLGAVWANASWGRYWGWDPKETWALITLLWFLGVFHGKFAGWLKGAWTAVATIAGFFLVLMTYYGVSFYLVGLHSYAGGNAKPFPPALIVYLAAELAFMAAVALRATRLSR